MYQGNKLILSNGTCLVIEGELVVCYDPYQKQINLTRGQQMMLKKLAANVNCAVKMTDLYAAYTGEIAPIDARGIRENVAKMKGTLPGFVKEAIKSVCGYGYQLIVTVDKNAFHNSGAFELGAKSDDCGSEMEKSKNAPGGFPGLLGDYYGFFLDPVGSGTVLGAYIHIENCGDTPDSDLKVSAILGIRSDDDLRDADIGQIFLLTDLAITRTSEHS